MSYVGREGKLTYMEKTQIYLPKGELHALRAIARRTGRSVADLVREAIRKQILPPAGKGPVGIWRGKPKKSSLEHDSIYDEL